jgi:hypothetical protein
MKIIFSNLRVKFIIIYISCNYLRRKKHHSITRCLYKITILCKMEKEAAAKFIRYQMNLLLNRIMVRMLLESHLTVVAYQEEMKVAMALTDNCLVKNMKSLISNLLKFNSLSMRLRVGAALKASTVNNNSLHKIKIHKKRSHLA